MKTKHRRLRAHMLMLMTALIWGVALVLVKVALQEIQPWAFALLRYLTASLGFAILLFLTHRRNLPTIERRDWGKTLAATLTGVSVYGVLIAVGINYSTASIGSLLNSAGPVFTLILSCIFLSERLTSYKIVGLGIALFGIVLVILRGSGDADFTVAGIAGPLFVAAALFLWSIYSIIIKSLLRTYPPFAYTAYLMIFGTFLLAPLATVIDWSEVATASPITWIAIVFIALGGTLTGQMLWNYALSILDASQVSVYLYLIPVITTTIAAVFLHEVVTVYFLIGGGMIVFGVALTNWTKDGARSSEVTDGNSEATSLESAKKPSTAEA